jgi:hypothetical protein
LSRAKPFTLTLSQRERELNTYENFCRR